jgi:hypothetical protein
MPFVRCFEVVRERRRVERLCVVGREMGEVVSPREGMSVGFREGFSRVRIAQAVSALG